MSSYVVVRLERGFFGMMYEGYDRGRDEDMSYGGGRIVMRWGEEIGYRIEL